MRRSLSASKSKWLPAKNVDNVNLHSCLNEAKMYTDLVQNHIKASVYENHMLKTAEKDYRKINPALKRSSSLNLRNQLPLTKQKIINEEKLASSNISHNLSNNPEHAQNVFRVFNAKTERISDLSGGLQRNLEEKHMLTNHIQTLKRQIMNEKKRKAKISLQSCKKMNHEELATYQIRKLEEESRKQNFSINQAINNCNDLERDVNFLRRKNKDLQEKISEELSEKNAVYERCKKTKLNLAIQSKELERLKEEQSIAYKNMINNYMFLNQLKEEKALLLASIHQSHTANS